MGITGLKSQRGVVTLMELVIATGLTAMVVLGIAAMQTAANSFMRETSAHTGFQSYYLIEKLSRWVEIGSAFGTQSGTNVIQIRLDYDDNTTQSTTTPVRNFTPNHTLTEDDDMWLSIKFFPGEGIYYTKKYNAPGNTSAPADCPSPGPPDVLPLTADPINALVSTCTFNITNPSSVGTSTVLRIDLTVSGTPSRTIQQRPVLGVSTK